MAIGVCAELPFPACLDPYESRPGLPVMVDADAMLSSIDNHYQRAGHPELPTWMIPTNPFR
jgi:hypothetical protein